jgi:hypothetical protein
MNIRNRKDLVDYVNHGNMVEYVFFWQHQSPNNAVSKSCFSQWYASKFKVEGITYRTAEHFMMAEKARLFGDKESVTKAISASNPGQAKEIGRSVRGFKEDIWLEKRFDIVVEGNLAKFSQLTELKDFLLSTEDRVLVEASPVDKVWGIGLASDDNNVENPNLWNGENLLGFALMEVRSQLRQRDAHEMQHC